MSDFDNFKLFQEVIKTGEISWDNVDYLCHWQSQILNNVKFSEELQSNNILDITEQIKHEHDDVEPNENVDDLLTDQFGERENQEEDEVSIDIKSKSSFIKRVHKSAVHEHFDKVKMLHPTTNETLDGASCKYCKTNLVSRVATNLKAHLKAKHPEAYDEVQSK